MCQVPVFCCLSSLPILTFAWTCPQGEKSRSIPSSINPSNVGRQLFEFFDFCHMTHHDLVLCHPWTPSQTHSPHPESLREWTYLWMLQVWCDWGGVVLSAPGRVTSHSMSSRGRNIFPTQLVHRLAALPKASFHPVIMSCLSDYVVCSTLPTLSCPSLWEIDCEDKKCVTKRSYIPVVSLQWPAIIISNIFSNIWFQHYMNLSNENMIIHFPAKQAPKFLNR